MAERNQGQSEVLRATIYTAGRELVIHYNPNGGPIGVVEEVPFGTSLNRELEFHGLERRVGVRREPHGSNVESNLPVSS
jgi:hypothetical protein